MPKATVTVREVKNVNTGIDVNIPKTFEKPGLIGKTTYYQVVVVTNLQCFKESTHSPSDVVQFMVEKTTSDFEHLRSTLSAHFSGTVFPSLPKKTASFLGSETPTQRKSQVEDFIKFIACTTKLIRCQPTLEFLGVSPAAAVRFAGGHANGSKPKTAEGQTQKSPEKPGLFDEEDSDEDGLFSVSSNSTAQDKVLSSPVSAAADINDPSPLLFDSQDLGGGLTVEEADQFMVKGAEDKDGNKIGFEAENNSDLLNIEDDLDKFLAVSKKQSAPKPEQLPKKPKIAPKPGSEKPAVAPKPGSRKPGVAKASGDAVTLDTDDITKYIQANTSAEDASLDLFS